MYVYECFALVCLCVLCVCVTPTRQIEGIGSPETEDDCEPNTGPPQEQPVLLTTEPPLQAQI